MRSRGGAAAAALVVVLVLITLSSSLLGGQVFSSGDNIFLFAPFSSERPAGWVQPSNFLLTDPVEGFVPDLLEIRADLSHGVLPWWNADAAGGRPLFASQVTAPLFPLTWLSFLLPFWTSFSWIAAAKLLLATTGTYLFVRELGLRRGPALLAGLAFGFGMFFVVWLEHPQTNVWLCLPWMFLAVRRVCAHGSLGAAALLGASTGLAWLGGHPESAAFQLAVAATYAAFELVGEHRWGSKPGSSRADWAGPSWTETLRGRAGLVIAGLVLGVGVSAIVDLPLVELLNQAGPTNRGGPPLSLNAVYSFVFPELWGLPNKLFSGVGPVNFNERTGYIGALPLLLAVGALGRRRPREVWFFVGLAIVSFALTFNLPLIAGGIRKLPAANVARLTRFLIILAFAGAVLAAFGLQRWITGSALERARMMTLMTIAAIVAPLFWLTTHLADLSSLGSALSQLPSLHYRERSGAAVALASILRWTIICVIGLGGLAIAQRRRWAAVTAIALVVVLTGADLVTLDRGYHGSIALAEANPPVPPAISFIARNQTDGRMLATDLSFPANLGQRYGLRDARVGVDIPYPSRWKQLWTALGGVGGDEAYLLTATPGAHQIADLFDVRYVLLSPGARPPAWLRPVLPTAGGTVAVNRTALPRAWVAYGWRNAYAAGNALALAVTSSTKSLLDQPVIEGVGAPPAGLAPAATPARVVDNSSDLVTIHAIAKQAGFLVLDDSAYPGWQASVDGRTTAWHPANENFRAVAIPAGSHTVVFHYRPAWVPTGTIVSVLSILALLGLAAAGAVSVRRRRRNAVVAAPVSA